MCVRLDTIFRYISCSNIPCQWPAMKLWREKKRPKKKKKLYIQDCSSKRIYWSFFLCVWTPPSDQLLMMAPCEQAGCSVSCSSQHGAGRKSYAVCIGRLIMYIQCCREDGLFIIMYLAGWVQAILSLSPDCILESFPFTHALGAPVSPCPLHTHTHAHAYIMSSCSGTDYSFCRIESPSASFLLTLVLCQRLTYTGQ